MNFSRSVCHCVMLFVVLSLMVGSSAARNTFGQGELSEPLPNITDIEVYDISGASTNEERKTGGTLVSHGVNRTFFANQSEWTEYRFTFEIRNDDTTSNDNPWNVSKEDQMFHDGLDTSWSIESGDIWFNHSGSEYRQGSFSSGKVSWDTKSGPQVAEGEFLFAKYIVNISVDSSKEYQQQFKVNDSEGKDAGSYDYHTLDVNHLGFLNLTLEEPPDDTVFGQNRTSTVNATITCESGECGEVIASTRYNESSVADTLIPENSGKPFHTDSVNTKSCDSSLLSEETCIISWDVNATGPLESYHQLDVNASSKSYSSIQENDTDDSLVQINKVFMINTSWNTTRFGVLDPGAKNSSALGNSGLKYNVTVESGSDTVDGLWTKASDLTAKNSDYYINASNMSFSTTNDISTETKYATDYQLAAETLDPGTIVNFFFWIDVPTGILKGEYNGTMFFKANSTR